MIDAVLLDRLYRRAEGERWAVPIDAFKAALEASVGKAFPDATPSRRELERYLDKLYLPDLALACACAVGDERAWDHFIVQQRPVLYRAADALDRTGRAREIADSLYGDLFGVREERTSLFRYYHGRSSLSTWLRAVLAQRYVDTLRADRRTSALDDEQAVAIPAAQPEPERARMIAVVSRALKVAVDRLGPAERLRLRAYYEQDLTLAQVGRLTREHEATVSRQIAKTRKALRRDIEEQLRRESRFTDDEIGRCVEAVTEDAGALDLRELFGSAAESKIGALDRSK